MTKAESKGTVLWVDDEPSLLHVVSRSLKFFGGYDVLVAETGGDALDIIKNRSISCVGTNIKMEPMDGVVMARALRVTHPSMPILFLTALTSGWRASDQAEVSDYIRKPFDVEDLVMAVSLAILHGHGWRSDRLREMVWQERGHMAQSVIDRVSGNLAEVAEACISTEDNFKQAAEEGRLFSQSFAFTNAILPNHFIQQGVSLLDSLGENPTAALGLLWEASQVGREHSRIEYAGGLDGVTADYRKGSRVGIVTLPGPRFQGEAFYAACVVQRVPMTTTDVCRYFTLEFQMRGDLMAGVLMERCLGGVGAVVRASSVPVDIDTFYRVVERILDLVPAPATLVQNG